MIDATPILHFLRPWWWLACVPLPFALWVLLRHGGGQASLARLADPALLPHLVRDTGARRRIGVALLAATWLLAVTALAGPAWQRVEAPLYVNGGARVVALSLSADMLARDLQPDRLTRARFAVRDLLDTAGDARTALVAFAGAAFTVAPLTNDKRTVENLLQALRPDVMPVAGNEAAAGIAQAVTLLQGAHVAGGEIVLVTDTADAAAVSAAQHARAQGFRVDVLGVGSREGAPVPRASGGFANDADGLWMARRDDAALRDVAAAGGGRYAVLQADGSGAAAFDAPLADTARASRERGQVWRDGGIWLLPVLVLLAALAFRRGWLLVLPLLVLPTLATPARAASLASWFATPDQQALHALHEGDPTTAARLAKSRALRGAAEYRAGRFDEAGKLFAQGNDARAHYNLGNALARQGKYPEALAAWRDALKRAPQMADARANIASVEAWMKQHPRRSNPAPGSSSSPRASASQEQAASKSGKRNPHAAGAASSTPSPSPSTSAPSTSTNAGAARADAQSRGDAARAAATSAQEAAEQQQQAAKATQGVARAVQQAPSSSPATRDPQTKAYALGREASAQDQRLDGEQRAMLRAVVDDPGALLRRKFQLEWEQRQNRADQGGPR